MANTTTAADNVVTRFLSDFFKEYVRDNAFSPYTGTNSNNPIVIKEGRQIVSIPLISKLSGAGVSGSSTLDGNEEALANYAQTLTPTYYRNAVRMSAEEREKPNIDLMRGAREMLMSWGMEKVRDDVIYALGSVWNGSAHVDVTAGAGTFNTAADTWDGNNSDRILFGSTEANLSGTWATDLAKVDTTADQLTGDVVRLARKIARKANPIVRPIRVAGGIETYVMFVGAHAMLKLKEDLETLHGNAGMRGEGNPLFRPGDLVWDNVVIREIPEIDTLLSDSAVYASAGAASAKVAPCFLCGAQALGYGLGQRPQLVVDNDKDYNFQPGVAVELKHDIDKLVYNDVDHGMVTVFVAGE